MENLLLSTIESEKLIIEISDKVTANILKVVQNNNSIIESSDQLLNVQETAQLLNLKVPTIYSKVSKGELPVMKRGKLLYFSKTELIGYLKSGRKKSNAEIEKEAEAYLSRSKKGGQQ